MCSECMQCVNAVLVLVALYAGAPHAVEVVVVLPAQLVLSECSEFELWDALVGRLGVVARDGHELVRDETAGATAGLRAGMRLAAQLRQQGLELLEAHAARVLRVVAREEGAHLGQLVGAGPLQLLADASHVRQGELGHI